MPRAVGSCYSRTLALLAGSHSFSKDSSETSSQWSRPKSHWQKKCLRHCVDKTQPWGRWLDIAPWTNRPWSECSLEWGTLLQNSPIGRQTTITAVVFIGDKIKGCNKTPCPHDLDLKHLNMYWLRQHWPDRDWTFQVYLKLMSKFWVYL